MMNSKLLLLRYLVMIFQGNQNSFCEDPSYYDNKLRYCELYLLNNNFFISLKLNF